MSNRISRRSAFLLAAAPAVARSAGQSAASITDPERLLEARRKTIQSNSRTLAAFKLKQSIEPAFQFRT